MDKNIFLDLLHQKLISLNISSKNIDKHIKQFEKYFSNMTDEEISEQIDSFDGVDKIASNIQILIAKKEIKESKVVEESILSEEGILSEESVEIKTDVVIVEQPQKIKEQQLPKNVSGIVLFWVIFVVTLPITIPLSLTIFMIFITVFTFLCVLIITLFASLIVLVVCGTGLCLIGIIFGISQMFKYVPIGLYELGIGVVIGGVSMLLGILMYNTAVRLLPFVIKQIAILFVYLYVKLKKLFLLAKKECEKL